MPTRLPAPFPLLLALILLALGVWLRLSGAFAAPLWLDEAYSAYAAAKGWAFLWDMVPQYETHPPLYYSLLRLWTMPLGDGLVAVRALGLVAGIATLPLAALAGHRIGRVTGRPWAVALAALLLAALWPLLIAMAREVRPYPLMILAYAGAILSLLALRERVAGGGAVRCMAWAAYVALLALMLWLHNLGPLYGAALGAAALILIARPGLSRADWAWLIGGHIIAGVLWLPALAILLDQAPMWIKSTWLSFQPDRLPVRLASLYATPLTTGLAGGAVLSVGALLALWRTGEGRRIAVALLVLALLPVAVSVVVSATVAPVFIVRTMTAVCVPAILLLASAVGGRGWRLGAALIGLVLLCWSMAAIDRAAQRRGPMQDWYAALDWLAPRFRPGDIVLAYPNEGALPFDRAVRDRGLAMPSRSIPAPIPALNPPPGSWYVSGSRGVPSLDRPHLRALALAPETRKVPTIWLLRLGPWAYDKGDVFLAELSAGRREVGRYRDGPIDIVGLSGSNLTARRDAPAGEGAAH